MQRFLNLFIFTDALHVSGSSSATVEEISSTVAASSSIGWQYLKLYVHLCAPDDGWSYHLKHVEQFTEI